MLEIIYKLWTAIFGSYCFACHKQIEHDVYLCPSCELSLAKIEAESTCPCCGRPMLSEKDQCINCRNESPPYKSAQSIYFYNEAARALLYSLKKRGGIFACLWFRSILKAFLQSNPQYRGHCLVTIPGNPRSNRLRGYDALCLIKKGIGGIITKRLLIHSGHGEQKSKKIADRKNGVIFYAKVTKGLDILLVDDVRTTDASIKIASLALLLGQARSVRVLTFFLD